MSSLREHYVSMNELGPLIQERLAAGQAVRFSPKGVSMLPMLREGIDSVLISPAPEKLQKFDIPLYQRENGQYILHRVIDVSEDYTCMGDNQFAAEKGIQHRQVIGVVTAFYRGERRWETTGKGYRMYCHVWHFSRPFRHLVRRIGGFLRRLFV